MKITYLKLTNYSYIFAAMKRKTIEIDLSKCKNRLVLFVGANGSGKTAILSQLQPFPFTIGDERSGRDIILENTTGFKEIRYDVNGHQIVIKHHITASTTKSYFSKNGTELNENGNVTSFKEIVEAELSITEETIKLMRLGTNTSTFLKMSSMQRKTFTGDLLNDIDVYGKMYRIVNDKFRMIRGVIKNVTNKLDSLNIIDRDSVVAQINNHKDILKGLNESRDNLVGIRATLMNDLNKYEGHSIRSLSNEIDEINVQLIELNHSVDAVKGFHMEDLLKALSAINNQDLQLSSELSALRNKLDNVRDNEERALVKIQEVESSLQLMTSGSEVGELVRILSDYDKKLKVLKAKFKDFSPKASSEDFRRLIDVFREIDRVAGYTNEFSHSAMVDVIAHINNGENIDLILHNEHRIKSNELESAKARMIATQTNIAKDEIPKMVIFKKNTQCNCPFEHFYNTINGMDSKDAQDMRKDIRSIEREIERVDEKFLILNNLNLIKMTVDANKELISRLPDGIMDFSKIINNLATSIPIYDEEYITSFISYMEEYEMMKEMETKMISVQSELNKLRANTSTIELLNRDLLDNKAIAEKCKHDHTTLTERMILLTKEKEDVVEQKMLTEKNISKLQESSQSLEKIRELNELVKEKMNIREFITLTIPKVENIGERLSAVFKEIDFTEKQLELITRKLMSYDDLTAELNMLNDRYETINYMRDGLSSNKGVPLLYIKLFMADINAHINDLIGRVYGNELEIQEFIINEKEFTIPYMKNGVLVSDISKVSQGEETFVSLAISFAFINRAINETKVSLNGLNSVIYNIINMDELDGPLDANKRQYFLDLIEEQLDLVGSEQMFLVSHNDVFSSYPLDAIVTSDIKLDNFRNMNVIFKA